MDRQTSVPELEPLRFGEIIDAGFRLWRKGFRELFIIAAIITVPVGVLGYLLERTQVVAFDSGVPIVRDVDQYNAIILIMLVLSLGASFLSAGATLVVTTRAYIDSVPKWTDAFRVTINRLFPFIGLSFLVGLAVGIGFVLLIVPGVIIGLGLSFAAVAFWAEGSGATESMRRSWKLAQGRRWPILGVWLVAFVSYTVISVFITGPTLVAFFVDSTEVFLLLDNVGSALVSALIAPLSSCLLTATYYDARVRREGFDLQLAASQLDAMQQGEPDDPYSPISR